jgi:2-octaprenyl-6-methoxyphenol hydroxylase
MNMDDSKKAASAYDVVIVGGGLVGISLAVALKDTSWRVALIEAAAPRSPSPPSFDDRGLALSIATQRILSSLALWESLQSRATPIKSIHISERGRFAVTRIHAEDYQVSALAHVVLARTLGEVMLESLAAAENCSTMWPARVVGASTRAEAAYLEVDTPSGHQQIKAGLIVIADGAQSTARNSLRVATHERDYGQTAIVSNVQTSNPHQGIAYERFTPQGPVAMLPQLEGRYGLVYVRPTALANSAMELSDTEFMAEVQSVFGRRAGDFVAIGRRACYPLRLCVAERVAGQRFVIAGNAAHAVHPNGAQGFNLGVRDVGVLSELLHDADRSHQDPGIEMLTHEYARRCAEDHARTVRYTDLLPRLFYNDLLPLSLLRSLGMLTVDLVSPFKAELFRTGSGLRGAASRSLRGLPL